MEKLLLTALMLIAAFSGIYAQEPVQEPAEEPVQLLTEEPKNATDKFADKILYRKPKSWFAKHFFIGAKFGVFNDWKQGGSTNFSYIIRPSFGYYINDRWAVGLKLNFIDSRLNQGEEGSVSIFDNINYTIAGLLMGKGLNNNLLSWEVKEFVRYRATKLFWDRLNLWIEVNAYQGMRFPRLSDGKLDKSGKKFIYGAAIYPAITCNITEKWMLYTSFELLSLSYDGAEKIDLYSTDAKDMTQRQGNFTFQANPLYAIAKAVVNISIIKSF